MMMDRLPVVVLDACVLFPAGLRSLLMWLAANDVIRAKWSELIHEEWIRNVLAKRSDLTRPQLERVRMLMDRHAGECLVTGFERHVPGLDLPDPDDAHVLAAAIECGADAIVTWNLDDFPAGCMDRFQIEAISPDELLCRLIDSSKAAVLAAMNEHRCSMKNPPMDDGEYRQFLKRQGLIESVARLSSSSENS